MNWLNGESYYDPTAGEVLDGIEGREEPLLVIEGATDPELLFGESWPGGRSIRKEPLQPERTGNQKPWSITNFEDFANGIIVQAANDYREARRILRQLPGDPEARKTLREVELFFLSRWYAQLTTLDGEKLLRMLMEETIE